nr:hypothetical protein [Tanacetum cinerariifolium]
VVAKKEVTTADLITTAGEVFTTIGFEVSIAAITPQISMDMDEITLAKALIDIKTSKPKAKGIVMQKPSETPIPILIVSTQQPSKLKNKSFEEVQKAFDNTISWINLFVPIEKDRAEGSKTRAERSSKKEREELESDKSKKQKLHELVEAKVDNDQRKAEMKMYMKIIPDDEIVIDTIPLGSKPPIIVD